eukprot:1152565-Pelagomonas_calceolata.AAC.14
MRWLRSTDGMIRTESMRWIKSMDGITWMKSMRPTLNKGIGKSGRCQKKAWPDPGIDWCDIIACISTVLHNSLCFRLPGSHSTFLNEPTTTDPSMMTWMEAMKS